MPPVIDLVRGRAGLREFIHLPEQLPGRRANWVPPIWADEWKFHDPKDDPAVADRDVVRFIARDGRRAVGRIMGIIHRPHNALRGERGARFYQLDAIEDQRTVLLLLEAVERWARDHGMDQVMGPFGFSEKDPQGLQVEGFEHLPVLATATDPPWLPTLVEASGYVK